MTTDKDIQVLEEMREERAGLLAHYRDKGNKKVLAKLEREHDALTNILSDFRDMRELLEAANEINIDVTDDDRLELINFGDGLGWGVRENGLGGVRKWDSAPDAWREVKKEGQDG